MTTCRGFRQITRSLTLGPFTILCFAKMNLFCVFKWCVNEAETAGAATAARRLDPKVPLPKKNLAVVSPSQTKQRPTLAPTLTAVCISSSDDSSSTSSSISVSTSAHGGGRGVSFMLVIRPPASVCTPPKPIINPPPASLVSKDETLIKQALRQSVENERLRAAKAMLYHAYMQALEAKER